MYKRIVGLRKEVLNSLEGINDDKNLMLLDSIDNFFEQNEKCNPLLK